MENLSAATFTAGETRAIAANYRPINQPGGSRPAGKQTMNGQSQNAPASAAELAGDLAPFAEQLGSPGGALSLGAVAVALNSPCIADAASLGSFLSAYRMQMLGPVELPAIYRAWQHASRFEARELIALDRQLGCEPLLKPFTLASLHTGRNQLRRLRPLRDQKLVQRYLRAIEAGEASGWHTLVYGVTLAIYSLPPRQGLLAYARQTLGGFAYSAARGVKLSEAELASVVDSACAEIPATINSLLAGSSFAQPNGALPTGEIKFA